MNNKNTFSFACLFGLFLMLQLTPLSSQSYKNLYKNLAFEMPVLQKPVFPDRTESILNYQGIGDGLTDNTIAFKNAMNGLSAKGGGKLLVPSGIWLTGPIEFQSNINLHLEKGAILLFTTNKDAYPLINTSFEGLETKRCQSPVSARNLENIAITGEGTINGNGQAWRPLKKGKVTESQWKSVTSNGGVFKNENYWFPSAGALKGDKLSESNLNVPLKPLSDAEWFEIRDFLRPVMISIVSCKNVLLEGVLFENSPSWNIHPLMCENIIIDNVFVRNPSYAQNGDGIDLESCKNAIIVNSTLDVGDDAICIKSGKDENGRKRAKPTENVIVDNCTVFKGHGGFVVGSEMSGGVRNISVTNCKFIGTDVGLRFKSTRGRGGVVENIYIDNISMLDIVTDSFLFDLYYGGKSASESLEDGDESNQVKNFVAVSEKTPVFRNIHVKNLTSRNARRAMFFNGLPEMNIDNITVENTNISATFGAELSESANVKFKDVQIVPAKGPAFILNNVRNMQADGIKYPLNIQEAIQVSGNLSQKIQINGIQLKD